MHPAIEHYIANRESHIETARSYQAAFEIIEDVEREIGPFDGVGISTVTDPNINVLIIAKTGDRVTEALRAFAKRGVHKRQPDPIDCPAVMKRIFLLTHGIDLEVALSGKNCRREVVGSEPKYAIVCG
jgi:hypothetical protein